MPDDPIRVYVVDYGRKFLQMRYVDPRTGKPVTRSSKCESRREAEKAAAVWEEKLRTGQWKPDGRMTWADFRVQYRKHHLSTVRDGTDERATGVLNVFERTMRPATIADVTPTMLAQYQAKLREGKAKVGKFNKEKERSDSTIATHTAHIKAALQWCVDMGYLRELPKFRTPGRKRVKKAKPMKGRPITDAEFQAMLDAVPGIVGEKDAPHWRRYLRGLWVSGLRLEESITLSWDDRRCLMVDTTGRRPVLHVPADMEKGDEDRVLPIAPEFSAFLDETPAAERLGPVFQFPKRKNRKSASGGVSHWWVSRIVSQIGEKAGIVVDVKSGKFASAHDLRRSFGSRWATRVMPQILMELMRHADISTTLRYYVGLNAERTADVLWEAFEKGNTSGNTKKPRTKK